MKQKDIILVVVIAVVAAIASFFVSKTLFVTSKNRQQAVEVAPAISTTFTAPSTKYFNANAIDPTQTITIGNNDNSAPFSKGQ